MEQTENEPAGRPTWLIIAGFAIVVVLIFAGLFLPPISLGSRLGLSGNSSEPADPAAGAPENDVAHTANAPEGVVLALSNGAADIEVVPPETFLSENEDATLSPQLQFASEVYVINQQDLPARGQVALDIPPDAGELKTLDLYGWDGQEWVHMPSQIDANSGQIVTAESDLPQAMTMVQAGPPATTAAGLKIMAGQAPPAELLPYITELYVGALMPTADGALTGEAAAQPAGPYAQWLLVTNVGPIVDQTTVATILSDPAIQATHIANLVSATTEDDFAGLLVDYQEIPAGLGSAYTTFISDLAGALHEQGLLLAVEMGTPAVAGSQWDTGGVNWVALGELADVVTVQLPLDPTEFNEGDSAGQLLNWATRKIQRDKVMSFYDASAVDRIGETVTSLSNEAALTNFGDLQVVEGGQEVVPNSEVILALSGSATPLEWDGDSLTYRYSYEKDGQQHDVWLGSEAALSHRLQIAKDYNIRGVSARGITVEQNGAAYADVFGDFLGSATAPQPTGAAIVWTVLNESGGVLASESGNAITFSWNVGDTLGEYVVNVDFALGDNIANLDSLDIIVIESTVVEEEPDEAEVVAEPAPEEGTEAVDGPVTAANVGSTGGIDAVVNVGANLRSGPGLTYGTISGGADPGTELVLIGRNGDASWLQVTLPDGQTAWIFSSLVTVNSSFDVNALEVVEVSAAPAAAPAAASDQSNSDGGEQTAAAPAAAAPPPPVAAAPVANAGFELGGQSHGFANPTLMSYAGMNWIKFQHKWGGANDDPNGLAGRIQQAHANGFKVLLSIPGTPYPSSIDFASYTTFLGGVAALGPDAIEVWNEMNIDFEWPAGQIDPNSYVTNMLAPAYNAIKSANPNVMVISGAPAPTGFFGGGCGNSGCDDSAYLAGMAAAGAGNYMDCMGAHFNAGATSPGQTTGHAAGSNHYSWYFQPMLDLYYGTIGKPVCFTELGYLSGEDFGGVPSRFSWAGATTVNQHAQWLAEAVSLAANSGKTRMVIIFNVDFTEWGDDPQAGYAMIRPDGGCPACETLRQVMGR